LHEELRLLHMAHLTNYQALQTATRNAAQFLGRLDEGIVREGARASLLLLEADPLTDIDNTKRIAGLLHHGRWRDAKELSDIRATALAAAPK
jgi:imidazolonepropionase-like amidohydrolase